MSRARPVLLPSGEEVWFDTKSNKATEQQLELLATLENLDLDDLLEETLHQNAVLERIREALGQDTVPESVIRKQEEWREQRHRQPECRICGKKGDSTKHHFVNRWILKELNHYARRWASRDKNCIPLCIGCHRDLHSRTKNGRDKSIVDVLSRTERKFAQEAISAFIEERPRVAWLVIQGDPDLVYEARLMRDWLNGQFWV